MESSDSRGSMSTPDIMGWDTDASLSTTDAALDILSKASKTPRSETPTDRLDLDPASAMDPERINECGTSPSLAKADTSSDNTSPISLQRFLTDESYVGETVSTPKRLRFDLSESGVWASGDGVEAYFQPSLLMLPRSTFLPYVHTFFQRLYPVFPVVDKEYLLALLQSDEHQEQPLPIGLYSFLAALSAAVIVQLNVEDLGNLEAQSSTFDDIGNSPRPSSDLRPAFSPQFFVSQCMQARQQRDFIQEPDEWTVLTSFFLFAYHGNLNQSQLAWYYLREAIGFIEALGLDESNTYKGLDMETAQRRCRIFWLLFITERAYAIQHRRRAVLAPTIDLPRVFESKDPKLVYGFVNLARVFAAVDEPLITAWRDQPSSGTIGIPQKTNQSIARYLRSDDVEGVPSDIEETQRLDILVTHSWLRVLVCQLQIGHTPMPILTSQRSITEYVLDTSRSLLQIILSASPQCLESHGIGMEQKVSDVASCLCDILAGLNMDQPSTDFFSASDVLNNFMIFLAGFRNHESQYLRPLVQKATTVLAARLHPSSFPTAVEDQMKHQEMLGYEEDESVWTKV
ncbi:amylase cluster transcriptional regulator [Fusarium beomiforme]|uniref:Amylase cluster transcriptional regulator n=1 Tax=Fusarium beomiforme TaxID=44412 RepID=A0A9P5DWA5_9HYPO|nr:amylase cluster transcriptional regulator [Fusarium beomiforme]